MKVASVKIVTKRYASAAVPAGLEIIPVPQNVTIALPSDKVPIVKIGDIVRAGQPLCTDAAAGMFAPYSGIVERVRRFDGGDARLFTAVDMVSRNSIGEDNDTDAADPDLPGERSTLHKIGRKCGIEFPDEEMSYCVLFVDKDRPDVVNRWTLEKESDKSLKVLRLLCDAIGRNRLFIVVAKHTSAEKKRACAQCGTVLEVRDAFPDTLPEIIIPSFQQLHIQKKIAVIDGRDLRSVAEYLVSGRPSPVSIISFQYGRNGNPRVLQVTNGMRFSQLLAETGTVLQDGDQLIVGGELTGRACYDLSMPVMPQTRSLLVIPAAEVRAPENNACVNCGRCVAACPVRLRADRIGKCVELRMIDDADALGIGFCIGCGICSAVCMTHRPLAHLMTTGKQAVAARVNKDGDL